MEKNELIAKINETLADEFEVEVSDITPDANIKETLQLDSLSLVAVAPVQVQQDRRLPDERI